MAARAALRLATAVRRTPSALFLSRGTTMPLVPAAAAATATQRRTFTRVRQSSDESKDKETPPPMAALDDPNEAAQEPLTAEEAAAAAAEAGLDERVAFVGSGAMASAILGGLLRGKRTTPDKVWASDTNEYRSEFFSKTFGVNTTKDNGVAVKDASAIFLSVKPQTVAKVMPSIKSKMREDAILLSIVAGYPIERLQELSGHKYVVRVMPNTPAFVGAGMTVWTPSREMDEHQCDFVRHLLASFGSELRAEEESYMDMVTALSGSGPAYFMLVMEAITDAGVHMGLPRRMARQIVIETMYGASQLARETGDHPAYLRENITSPGGTTAAALFACEEGGLRTVLQKAAWAAYRRSLEVGGRDSNVGPGRAQPSTQPIELSEDIVKELASAMRD